MRTEFLIMAFFLMYTACTPLDTGIFHKDPVEFTTIEKGYRANPELHGTWLIRSSAEFEEFWKNQQKVTTPLPEIPDVDFEKKMVLYHGMGLQSTGGYEGTIAEIGILKDRLHVTVIHYSPGPTCIVIQAATSPFHLVELEKLDHPLDVQIREITREC